MPVARRTRVPRLGYFVVLCVFGGFCAAEARMATGTYNGDGAAGRSINVGFAPDIVIIKVDYEDIANNDNSSAVIRTSTMVGDSSKPMIGLQPLASGLVQSLDAAGFTVGSDLRVNASGAACGGTCTYYWVAFQADANVDIGTYTGNGTNPGDPQSITGMGFSPDYVMVLPATTRRARHRTRAGTTHSRRFSPNGAVIMDAITSLDASGFTVTKGVDVNDDVNESGVTYHYVAWNAVPGRVAIGEYAGNETPNRQITSVGFQPEYLILQAYDDGKDPFQRTKDMVGDASVSFRKAIAAGCIQNLLPTGFEISASTLVNEIGFNFSYVAFGSGAGCSPLATSDGGTSITVTAPGSFEMTFDTASGGSVREFYDLAEDPGKTSDLAGGITNTEAFPNAIIRDGGGTWTSISQNETAAKITLLEATQTRVRVRQEAFYEEEEGAAILPGIKGFGDFSVYPGGKMAWHWEQRAELALAYMEADFNLSVFNDTVAPFNGWQPFSESGSGFPGAFGGAEDFTLLKSDIAGNRTDFLNIMDRDWSTLAGHNESATEMFHLSNTGTQKRRHLEWRDRDGGSIAAGSTEDWNFLVHFKPTDLGNTGSPWLDPAVVGRRDDYRTPDDVSGTDFAAGTRWDEDGNNDGYNETEAAYTFSLDPASGLTFDMDGSGTTRYGPFLKIRNWRSLADPETISVEGVTKYNDVHYLADVKPVARAHWAPALSWHCSLESTTSCAPGNLDAGATGSIAGGVTIQAAKHGNGAEFTATTHSFSAGATGNADFSPTSGAVDFWYQPYYDHDDSNNHILWYNQASDGNGDHCFLLEKNGVNQLRFSVVMGASNVTCTAGGTTSFVTVASGSYFWRAYDWVHIKTAWSTAGVNKLRLFVDGVQVGSSISYTAPTAHGPTVFGGCALNCPGGGTGHANGMIDEPHIYTATGFSNDPLTRLAYGGLTSESTEAFGDPTWNFQFGFTAVDASFRGPYLYVGSDSPFNGLNVALGVDGVPAGADLRWMFWNGATGAWDLMETAGFVDGTNQLTGDGTVQWGDANVPNWAPYSVDGGPDLYYVRVRLDAGSYSTFPSENVIKTDVLLFQYCEDVTTAATTFDFSPPVPTAVALSVFEAHGAEGTVELFWETASELDNLGFHLYRADAESGPYERITLEAIPGLGSSPSGARYRYTDAEVVPGQRYYYELEDIETTGRTKRHGPVSAVPTSGVPGGDGDGEASSSGGLTYGNPSGVEFRVLERTRRGLLLELRTEGFDALVGDDGSVEMVIPGLDVVSETGFPALPVKRVWVEIDPERGVRLASVRAEDVEVFDSLRPAATGEPDIVASHRGTVRAGRRAPKTRRGFSGQGAYPEWAARVVDVGYQGEVKKALVELAPLRWERARDRLVLARRLVVRLEFGRRDRNRHQELPSHAERPSVTRRLVAREAGLYGVGFEDLFGGRGRTVPASSLRLSRQGRSVAFHIEPAGRSFGPGSMLYFVSEGASLNPFGHEAVYELELGVAGGERMPVIRSAGDAPEVGWYWREVEREVNRYYQAGLLDAPDRWFWDLILSPASKSFDFELGGLWSAGPRGALTLRLQGASDAASAVDHHVRVYVNGVFVAEERFDGKTPLAFTSSVPAGALREGVNELTLENVGDAGAPYSMVLLDSFSVSYPSSMAAARGSLRGVFATTGFANATALGVGPLVVDITEGHSRWVEAFGGRFPVEGAHEYLAASSDVVRTPEVSIPRRERLKNRRQGADYLIVGPDAFLEAARPLLDARRSQGLRSLGVSVEQIESEFGHGEASPRAIREFLSYAYHHWKKPAPRYVVLLGDGSYDFKDYLKTGVENHVPPLLVKTTYLWTASDPTYAAVNGDDVLPDLAIGRLPAASVEQARVLVGKILAYEGRRHAKSSVLVADNPDRAGDFERDADEIARGWPASQELTRIYLGRLGTPATRAAIVEAFDEGAWVVSYLGHGGIHLWASENIFDRNTVGELSPQADQPLVLTMNCLNGYFHFPYFDSLAEELVEAEGAGAIAAFSPSGLSLNAPAQAFQKALLGELLSGGHVRLGDAVLAAQERYAATGLFPDLLQIYHLLGDPALVLPIPAN